MTRYNVVYHIFCGDCKTLYVRQIKRQLRIRQGERKFDIKKENPSFVIARHKLDLDHDIYILIGKMSEY